MSHTNSTPNYSLPQWLSTDKPAWMADVNVAFSDIDTQMKLNSDAATAAQTTADAAVLNSAPGYSNVSTYQIDDVVTYQGRSYKCIVDITTPENWDGTKWTYFRLSDISNQVDNMAASDIEYQPGVSVEDALDNEPKWHVVAQATGTDTVSNKLISLFTAYNALSSDKRRRCYIDNDGVIFHYASDYRFGTCPFFYSSKTYFQTIVVSSSTPSLRQLTIATDGTMLQNDMTSDTTNTPITLYSYY